MKHAARGKWYKFFLWLAFTFVCYIFVTYVNALREIAFSGRCQENMRLVYQTTVMYAADYDSHYPLEARWTDSLKAYSLKAHPQVPNYDKTKMFSCPVLSKGSGYGYNSDLSSKSLSSVLSPETTILAFETDHLDWNYSSHKMVLPVHTRHGVNWEVYADGHRKASP